MQSRRPGGPQWRQNLRAVAILRRAGGRIDGICSGKILLGLFHPDWRLQHPLPGALLLTFVFTYVFCLHFCLHFRLHFCPDLSHPEWRLQHPLPGALLTYIFTSVFTSVLTFDL